MLSYSLHNNHIGFLDLVNDSMDDILRDVYMSPVNRASPGHAIVIRAYCGF